MAIYGVEEVGLTTGTGFFFAAMAGGMVLSRLLSAGLMKKGMLNESVLIGTLLMIVGYSVFIFLMSAPFFYLSAVLLGVAYGYVCPAFQAIFINLSRHNQRGAANSSYFISWDLGIGLGGVDRWTDCRHE
ncbi:MAG: hypothetical protein LUD74_08740 [Tannerellaceae bacterium]|nr:hypothetical protein [Tannerellaceae bacterium]